MTCNKCNSKRVATVGAKCGEQFRIAINPFGQTDHVLYAGDVLLDVGIARKPDYLSFRYCLDCGQLQGDFPLPVSQQEEIAKERFGGTEDIE